MTPLREAIQNEINEAAEKGLVCERIRVSAHALPGSVIALPIQSKRFELGIRREKRQEILVHPDDWAELLLEMEGVVGHGVHGLRRAFGLPVADEP